MRLYSSIQTPNWELQKIQDNVSACLNPIAKNPLLDGVLIEGVPLTTGVDNNISHLLDRKPRMWLVVKKDADSNVWEETSPAPGRILNLRCSANCNVSLWVA